LKRRHPKAKVFALPGVGGAGVLQGVLFAIALALAGPSHAGPTAPKPGQPVPASSPGASVISPSKPPPSTANALWDFLNSPFVSALLAGVVGAGVGAYGGAEIVRRQQERNTAHEEVRAVNVAIAHVLFILNWTTALKRQHLRGMVAKYKDDCDRREALLKTPGPQVLQFTADMETLPVVELPVQPLKATVFERLDAPTPAYAMCTTLSAVASTLQAAIEERNDFIEEKRRGPKMTDDERAAFYFGLRSPDGVTDARYPTLLDAISHYTDATTLYAMILAALLMDHGKDAAEVFGKKKPKVTTMNVAAAFADELVPDLAEYKDMLQNMGIDAATLLGKYGAPPLGVAPEPPAVPGV
jgi:hypothetical protein